MKMITDIETIKKIIPSIIGNDFSKYSSSIDNATAWFVAEMVGSPLYEKILLLPFDSNIYVFAQKIIAYQAYLIAIPMLDVVETNNGFAIVSDEKLTPASTARVQSLITSLANNLASTVDLLCSELENDKSMLELWRPCVGCSFLFGTLLPTLSMFRLYGTFTGTRSDYAKRKASIKRITRDEISPVISNELVTELIEQSETDSLTSANLAIIDDVRASLALWLEGFPSSANLAIRRVRKVLERSPEAYPAFAKSQLYQDIMNRKPAGAVNGIGVFF